MQGLLIVIIKVNFFYLSHHISKKKKTGMRKILKGRFLKFGLYHKLKGVLAILSAAGLNKGAIFFLPSCPSLR